MNFKTKLNLDLNYKSTPPKDYSYDNHSSKTEIHYNLDVEYKNWGINGIYASMNNQNIFCYLDLLGDGQEDSEEFSVTLELSDIQVESDDSFHLNDAIVPKELEVTITSIQKSKNEFLAKGTGILKF